MYIDNVGAIHESPLRILRRRSPLPAFLCGISEMPWKKTFLPPDFGGAHRSDPRLHVQFYAYYFGDAALGAVHESPRPASPLADL